MNNVLTDISESLQDDFLEEFARAEQEEQNEDLRQYISGLSKDLC